MKQENSMFHFLDWESNPQLVAFSFSHKRHRATTGFKIISLIYFLQLFMVIHLMINKDQTNSTSFK